MNALNPTNSASQHFLHPRYWLTWLAYGLLWVIVRLPHPLRTRFGGLLGRLAYYLAARRRRIVETNLRLCFPELDEAARRTMAKEVFRSGGISLTESALSWMGIGARLADRCQISGFEHLEAAYRTGRGVILLGTHLSTFDAVGAVLATKIPIDVMFRPNGNPLMERLMTAGRKEIYHETIVRKDIRRVIRNLRQGHVLWYAVDQDFGVRSSVFAPFFGIETATMTGLSRLVKSTGAVVIPFAHYREDGGASYRVELSPPLQDIGAGSLEADAARINQFVENAIRVHPEQYWWFHRRFKSRPPGHASLY